MHEPVSRSAVVPMPSINIAVSYGCPAKLGPLCLLYILVPPSGPVTEALTCFPVNFFVFYSAAKITIKLILPLSVGVDGLNVAAPVGRVGLYSPLPL